MGCGEISFGLDSDVGFGERFEIDCGQDLGGFFRDVWGLRCDGFWEVECIKLVGAKVKEVRHGGLDGSLMQFCHLGEYGCSCVRGGR